MMLNKILNEISASEVKSSPFPHIVIDNLLDNQTMNELHEELSNIKLNDIASPRGEKIVVNGNQQYGSYVINQASLESNEDFKISSELNKNLSSNEFINSLLNKLSGYIENSSDIKISDITKNLEKNIINSEISILPSSYSSKRREIHLDSSEIILVFLYYVRLPNDYSFGGSLNLLNKEDRYLFRSKTRSLIADFLNIYPSDLSVEKTYDYKDNRLVVMASSGYSWHEVSTRRKATTPRINFHGSVGNYLNKYETEFQQNKSLGFPIKNKLKFFFKL